MKEIIQETPSEFYEPEYQALPGETLRDVIAQIPAILESKPDSIDIVLKPDLAAWSLGDEEIKNLEQIDAGEDKLDYLVRHLMSRLYVLTTCALPCSVYPDFDALCPFNPEDMTTLFTTPLDQMNLKKELADLQKKYLDHALYHALPLALEKDDKELLHATRFLIWEAILNHTDNSKTYLDDEKRPYLITIFGQGGVLTESLEQEIRSAGIVSSVWEAFDFLIAEEKAQQAGTLFTPPPGPHKN